ncbi:hypothetical protein ACJX0J_020390, partial [Zea mays]
NLIDAANIAALAALSTFWRPECTVGGDDGQQVTVHDPEVRDPLPLTIHHMPIAITFAYFGEGNIVVLDPTYKEEAVMGWRMTAIVNSNGDEYGEYRCAPVEAAAGFLWANCVTLAFGNRDKRSSSMNVIIMVPPQWLLGAVGIHMMTVLTTAHKLLLR